MKSLMLLVVLIVFSVLPSRGQENDQADRFEIRIPPAIRKRDAQLRYFLTGPFGGYGEAARRVEAGFVIPTRVEGEPAEHLKAVIYVAGCQLVTLDIGSIRDFNGAADFICNELPAFTLKGKIILPEDPARQSYFVEANYMAYWAHNFFGIADGIVTSFSLGRFTPDRQGVFQFRLPDFSKDQATRSFKLDAGIQFIARERATLNILAHLVPSDSPPGRVDMPILKTLPPLVILRPYGKR